MGPKENRSHDNFRIQRADWRDRPSLTDFMCVYAQSCPTLSEPINCGPPGSSVHGIFQARILEQVAFPPPGDLPDPGIKPTSPALAGGFFTIGPPGKPLIDLLELNDIRWRRKWQPTPVFLPGKSHWWRSVVGYSPWGRKESDKTERLHSLTQAIVYFLIIGFFEAFVVFYLPEAYKVCSTFLRCVWWLNSFFMDTSLPASHKTQFAKH